MELLASLLVLLMFLWFFGLAIRIVLSIFVGAGPFGCLVLLGGAILFFGMVGKGM